jgi:hypothetical protein
MTVLVVSELGTPLGGYLLHNFAVTIASVLVQPGCDLWKVEVVLHHETHRVLQTVIALVVIQLILEKIQQLAYRVLLRGKAVEKSLQLLAAHLFEIFDLTFSYNGHNFLAPKVRP